MRSIDSVKYPHLKAILISGSVKYREGEVGTLIPRIRSF